MNENRDPTDAELAAYRKRFTDTVLFLHDHFGGAAFHNISSTHPDRLVTKFNPTIFDSLMIAADFALAQGDTPLLANAEEKRRQLLTDPGYRLSISKETMRTASIRTRISKAAKILFDLDYA